MRPIDVKAMKYRDNLASKRRRNFNIKATGLGILAIALLAGLGYALFYASWLKVTNITFEGLTPEHQSDIQHVIDEALNHRLLGLPVGRDILFVHASSLNADLADQFSFIDSVSVQKKYFHTLNVVASERQAEGVWCFQSDCRFFDHAGVTFGHAVESSGVLLLNVDDLRIQSASVSLATADKSFLTAIQTAVSTLTNQDIKVKKVTIPQDSYTEFDVLTGEGYPVKLSLDSDIPAQLEVFRIFRGQKMADGTLHPQYIDLRYDGRVYFK